MKVFIYGLQDLATGKICYVGQTKNPKTRPIANLKHYRKVRRVHCAAVILEQTTARRANEREEYHFNKHRSRGGCQFNGPVYFLYPWRDPVRARLLRERRVRINKLLKQTA